MALVGGGYSYGVCDDCQVRQMDGTFSARLTYLTIPLLATYRVGKLALSAGPYIGFKVGERQAGQYTIAGSANTYTTQPTALGGYKRTDAGYVLGLTYAVTTAVAVDVRYNHGLRSVTENYKEGYVDIPYVSILRNQSAQLALRYYLRR